MIKIELKIHNEKKLKRELIASPKEIFKIRPQNPILKKPLKYTKTK